ncbi:formate dehydrogenase accessory sulfurtransferase FdhD [Archangium lipolyticum]|uniref:formate dehydrogenase accessory sulfurtransferase FdhD n=1 Tax=Archangium lipolyticum TaxID=2970465 RepID=UPI00214A66AB|nr:formate dehydrogenase accessory sulfurtransferase FdhD [Archangium lipolyticum]
MTGPNGGASGRPPAECFGEVVSAACSLAIDSAERAGLTLATFARDGRLNLYTHPECVRAG